MSDQATRIKEKRKALGLTQDKLAKRVGVSRVSVTQWENDPTIEIAGKNLTRLCVALETTADHLLYGKEEVQSSVSVDNNVREVPQPIRYQSYPVISRVQAGKWAEAVVPYAPGAEQHYESSDYQAQGRAFWLEVEGDSMTAPPGVRPSVPEGTLVLVDTGVEAVPGKLVVAQLDDSNEATFKKLIEDGGQRYLKALNPAYPLIAINGNCRIVGVAVEAKTRL